MRREKRAGLNLPPLREDTPAELIRALTPTDLEIYRAARNAHEVGSKVPIGGLSRRLGVSPYSLGCRVAVLVRLGLVRRTLSGFEYGGAVPHLGAVS